LGDLFEKRRMAKLNYLSMLRKKSKKFWKEGDKKDQKRD